MTESDCERPIRVARNTWEEEHGLSVTSESQPNLGLSLLVWWRLRPIIFNDVCKADPDPLPLTG
jgi:hypothetical protein